MFENRFRSTWAYGRRLARLGCGAALSVSVVTAAQANECALPLKIEGGFGQAAFTIAIADDPAERAQGLMHVESMPRFSGMLFIYEAPQSASFWMRNTLIPLDMLFADADGVITHIHPQAVPLDETPILGGDDVKYVLEINGGMADRLGVEVGDRLSHASLQVDVECD